MNERGQSVTEYAIVFSVVAAAIIGMQLFVKRGLQGKEKDVIEYFAGATGGQTVTGTTGTIATGTKQYEPYYTAAGTMATKTANAPYTEAMTAGGKIARTGVNDQTERSGTSTEGVALTADDDWK